jgi:hypothetical protein
MCHVAGNRTGFHRSLASLSHMKIGTRNCHVTVLYEEDARPLLASASLAVPTGR